MQKKRLAELLRGGVLAEAADELPRCFCPVGWMPEKMRMSAPFDSVRSGRNADEEGCRLR